MKLKNIYANKINIEGKPVEVGQVVDAVDSKSTEVKNLIKHGYVEVVAK